MAGLNINNEGKIKQVRVARTLDEVDRRVNSLKKNNYIIEQFIKVQKYCICYLKENYFDAVFEAAKGL